MKKFVSSLLIFSFVVLLTPICPIYAANTLNYNANASSGITASGNISTATVDGQSVFYADTTTGNKTIYFDICIFHLRYFALSFVEISLIQYPLEIYLLKENPLTIHGLKIPYNNL